ncbi:MAG: aminotransferase class V-fold PLP-dependent enzyme [Candidatus Kapabacteria bacterium]|nr:aminotransferase class V-fold PLP-dependent enzyme [Candidatus Kapabacteria bacterium]
MTSRRSVLKSIAAFGPTALFGSQALHAVTHWMSTALPGISAADAARDEDFWLTVQQAFAVDRTIVNLNNGGVSPSPRTVQDAMRRYTEQANGIPAYELWRHQEPMIETVRDGLASIFSVNPEEVAVTRNASESLQSLQMGLPMEKGDEVVTTTQDYPRMLTAWDQRVRRDGIVVKKVKFPVPLMNSQDAVDAIAAAITPRTKVIHISHVVFLTGQIMPVRDICRLAKERGVLCFVDGAHSFAHFPFTQKDLECEFFGTSLHKWFVGPIGTGMLYVKKDRIPSIWPLMAAPKEQDANIRKFEEIGTHPAAIHNSLIESITFHRALGVERKAARLRYLHSIWTDRLGSMQSVRFLTNIKDDANQCGLRLVHIEGTDPGKLSTYLLDKHRIFTVAIVHDEFKGLRIAPSVYTTVSEVERFADAMMLVASGQVKDLG